MSRGRRPLDAETKAKNRAEAVKRYAAKYVCAGQIGVATAASHFPSDTKKLSVLLAESTCARNVRARNAEIVVSEGCTPKHVERARAARATYREKHKKEIRAADALRRQSAYLEQNGTEAFDEQRQRAYMTKTQKRHEGRPPPPKPPSENQRRRRALRTMHLEEDNGNDSDADDADDPDADISISWEVLERRYPPEVFERMEEEVMYIGWL
ncbi:hypothetical protein B0H16DRAFT_1752989 [Mycena metata]|uniref:Uncharacterized protein n=1 Tax=Mycena metata TaxID=1033252 RepID=A0AAD7DDQ9_9AGAR|nr:hypothetical protein B0H16DRAFT_1752989 [Mycena metata]